jgi:uncharacterized protein (UPF0264 family)
MVVVGYADWQLACAPALDEVVAFACRAHPVTSSRARYLSAGHPSVARSGNILLLDTYCKESRSGIRQNSTSQHAAPQGTIKAGRPTLLDWLTPGQIRGLCETCHSVGVRVAVAGSLGQAEIEALLDADPDWFAVRGAVCGEDNRLGTIAADKIAGLVRLLDRAN